MSGVLSQVLVSIRQSRGGPGSRIYLAQLGTQLKRQGVLLDERLGVPIVQHLYCLPEDGLLGIAERRAPWSPSAFISQLNDELLAVAPGNIRWLDVDYLAASVGRLNWRDPRLYHHGKLPFSPRFLPNYAAAFAGAWRGVSARTKKVLVVDLDNTLWGGVVGDDGVDGIEIGPGTPAGEAFADFGDYLGQLRRRGVVLAIASKNDEQNVREVFERHPALSLRLDDFAAVAVNWSDKASNLRRLAGQLNLDLSSFVFVDDNPAERDLIRRELPMVTVVDLPEDPAYYRRAVDALHLFDSAYVSADDLKRAASYVARRQAVELQSGAGDLSSYLESLDMYGTLWPARQHDLPRLAQLELKTNQFNLTFRRYAASDIERLIVDPDALVLCFSLADRFGDHGLVSSLIARFENGALRIDSWLMSCRVFSRTAEEFMLAELVALARARGAATILGEFIAGPKNDYVAGLFARLGFIARDAGATRWWTLDTVAAFDVRTAIQPRQLSAPENL